MVLGALKIGIKKIKRKDMGTIEADKCAILPVCFSDREVN